MDKVITIGNYEFTMASLIFIGLGVLLFVYYFWSQNKKSHKPKPTKPQSKPSTLKWIGIGLILVACVSGYYVYQNSQDKDTSIPLSEAIILSKSGTFDSMIVHTSGLSSSLELTVSEGVDTTVKDVEDKEVTLAGEDTVIVDAGNLALKDLADMGFVLPLDYRSETAKGGGSTAWMSYLFMLLILGFFAYYYFNIMGSGSSHKFKKDESSITFKDIGGINEVKDSLTELVNFLKDKSYFDNLGAKIPKGVLLEGSPGTGKTMLARAIANEAGVPFYYTTGSEFHSTFVGVAALKVKKLFKQAGKSPSVIFIDEFDSIAHSRGNASTDVGREWNHTLNQLLSEMDGFKKNNQVIVLAATNRADVLDSAVLRPGRFDRKIVVPLPSLKDRIEILKIHSQGKPIAKDVMVENIARQTVGFSGAELSLLMNESAIIAGKSRQNKISHEHIVKAIDKVLAGDERKNLSLTEDDKKLIAYHEAGHALVASLVPEADKVQRISILPRGNAGGFTRTTSDNEMLVLSKSKAMSMIAVFLGGRVAEEIVLNKVTSSAQNDLMRANQLAKEMVEHYGMSQNFGLRYALPNSYGVKEISLESQKVVDKDIELILNECYASANEIINEHRALLDKIATELLVHETLDTFEIEKILKDGK